MKAANDRAKKTPMHLPVSIRGPSEDKAAGDELRDDSGTKALRSCEQSGLAGSFSILAHYFPTSSASFHTLDLDFNSLVKIHRCDPVALNVSLAAEREAHRLVIQSHRRDLKL